MQGRGPSFGKAPNFKFFFTNFQIEPMAQNYVKPGDRMPYTVPANTTIVSGQVVVIGNLCGVALSGGTQGTSIEVQICGVFRLAKATPLVIVQGDRLFWDIQNNVVTKTTSHQPLGIAASAAASADATADVLLAESGVTPQAAANADVASPNATDLGTNNTLTNELKTQFNALQQKLRAVGLLDT